jgi:hypothetical protein
MYLIKLILKCFGEILVNIKVNVLKLIKVIPQAKNLGLYPEYDYHKHIIIYKECKK